MGIETGTALLLAALGTGAASIYQGHKAASAQQDATDAATKAAKTTADAAEEATNKANQKRPNSSALLSSNQEANKGGTSGTMLTGPAGVAPAALQLGKTTLLGG